jgi:hypothetical protein
MRTIEAMRLDRLHHGELRTMVIENREGGDSCGDNRSQRNMRAIENPIQNEKRPPWVIQDGFWETTAEQFLWLRVSPNQYR